MKWPKKLILFVCTGNICRSPMAEALFNHALPPESPWRAKSAGLMASHGHVASDAAIAALQELHISLANHRSQLASRDLVDAAFCIVVMTRSHASQLETLFPNASDRIHLLRSFDPGANTDDVDDPIGMSLEAYREARDAIRSAIPGLIQYLNDLETD